jgi:hypothetical protein
MFCYGCVLESHQSSRQPESYIYICHQWKLTNNPNKRNITEYDTLMHRRSVCKWRVEPIVVTVIVETAHSFAYITVFCIRLCEPNDLMSNDRTHSTPCLLHLACAHVTNFVINSSLNPINVYAIWRRHRIYNTPLHIQTGLKWTQSRMPTLYDIIYNKWFSAVIKPCCGKGFLRPENTSHHEGILCENKCLGHTIAALQMVSVVTV